MKSRLLAFAAIAVLILNTAGLATADTRRGIEKQRESSRLVAMLPASDGIAVFDARRFVNVALPRLLSANRPMLAKIMAQLTELEAKSGIDLRKFDQVAVGVSVKDLSAKNVDVSPVVIFGGDINAGALVALAKIGSKGDYREEKIGGRSIYVFSMKSAANAASTAAKTSAAGAVVDDALKNVPSEIAVTALDSNTLAAGSLERLRETIEGTSHVSSDLVSLLSVKDTSIMSFAFKAPDAAAKALSLDNDELGKNVDSIDFISGSLDVAAAGTSLQVAARTRTSEQAQSLKDTLEGLQIVGKALLGNSKRADRKVYGRMLRNVKCDARGTDVSLDLLVPQADIDILVGGIK
jgi:hypothetical protein